jgi:CRP/FNR family cyclic AMP-dependent transcriptional regulator
MPESAPRMKITLFSADANIETFPAGQTIFKVGDPGDYMFAVASGAVDIIVHGKVMETVRTGGIFGEMALVEDRPRGATVVVTEDAGLVRIDRKRFLFLVQHTPFFSLQLMAVMAERLRHMNEGV